MYGAVHAPIFGAVKNIIVPSQQPLKNLMIKESINTFLLHLSGKEKSPGRLYLN